MQHRGVTGPHASGMSVGQQDVVEAEQAGVVDRTVLPDIHAADGSQVADRAGAATGEPIQGQLRRPKPPEASYPWPHQISGGHFGGSPVAITHMRPEVVVPLVSSMSGPTSRQLTSQASDQARLYLALGSRAAT